MNKLLVICGPTATGKTDLAIKMAKKFNGEIISADSRQVYKGMNIGTGKEISNLKSRAAGKAFGDARQISKRQIKNQKFTIYELDHIPMWLWDIVEPDEEFSAADYYRLTKLVIKDIWRRGKLPFLVGGTGFYIKTLVDGIESLGIEPDFELREKLKNLKTKELRSILVRTCPERLRGMNESDRQNPRRLIRAIEIAKKYQISNLAPPAKPLATHGKYQKDKSKIKNLKTLFIGLTAPNKVLYQRIDRRVEKRVKEGIIGEIESLLRKGCRWDLPSMSGIGYREFRDYFEKKVTLEEVAQRWKFDEHGYVRRQMTWFKKDSRIRWFNITQLDFASEVEKLVADWYNGKEGRLRLSYATTKN